MKRFFLYLAIAGICFAIYAAGKEGLYPEHMDRFMSAYGFHAVAGFGCPGVYAAACLYFGDEDPRLTIEHLIAIAIIGPLSLTSNELLQFFEPGRVVDAWDVLAQLGGFGVGMLLVWATQPKTQK